ncbi:hypothetical protein BJX70DRAFT_138569 [Aspergillus crustosus]
MLCVYAKPPRLFTLCLMLLLILFPMFVSFLVLVTCLSSQQSVCCSSFALHCSACVWLLSSTFLERPRHFYRSSLHCFCSFDLVSFFFWIALCRVVVPLYYK